MWLKQNLTIFLKDLFMVKLESLLFVYQVSHNPSKIIIFQPFFKCHPYILILEKYVEVDSQQVWIYKIILD